MMPESISLAGQSVDFDQPRGLLGDGEPRLFVIGDSQACGTTGAPSQTAKDVDLNGTPAHVFCKVGAHTSEFASVVPTLDLARGDAVLVFLGSNDYDSKPDPTAIVNAIKATGATYLWVGPPSIHGKPGTAPAHLQSVLGDNYFDSHTLDLKLRDEIHPTPSEFARWRSAVLAEVAARGMIKGRGASAFERAFAALRRPAIAAAAALGVVAVGGGIYWVATRPAPRRLPARAA